MFLIDNDGNKYECVMENIVLEKKSYPVAEIVLTDISSEEAFEKFVLEHIRNI